eukprot:621848-Hanusia_phi.AAC.2
MGKDVADSAMQVRWMRSGQAGDGGAGAWRQWLPGRLSGGAAVEGLQATGDRRRHQRGTSEEYHARLPPQANRRDLVRALYTR